MPVTETAAIVAMAKAALDTVLNVGQLIARGASKKELREHVEKLTQHLHELINKFTELHRSNLLLTEEVDLLKQQLKTRDEFVFDRAKGSYWRKTEDGQLDGPFCPKCMHGTQRQAVPLVYNQDMDQQRCPVCDYRDRPPTLAAGVAF